MREYNPELVVEFPGRSVVIIRQKGEGDEKRGLHSTLLLQNIALLSHVSIYFGFLTGPSRYFVLKSDWFLWPHVDVFFYWGGGSWLDFFYVVLLTSTDTTQRSPEVDHVHGAVNHEWGAACDRNLSHWISEKRPWRRLWISEEIIFVFESLCHKPSIWSG